MPIPIKNHWRGALVLFAVSVFFQAATVFAVSPRIIVPNPQQQGIPELQRDEVTPQASPQKTSSRVVVLPEQQLPSAIRRIDLQSPLFRQEIDTLLRPFIGMDRISGSALAQVRGQIWELYRQHGRMTRVEIQVLPASAAAGGSVLQVRINFIRVRTVRVLPQGDVSLQQDLIDSILAMVQADIAEEDILDLERIESRIKRRLFLKDVSLRATLLPVDAGHVDVNVEVSAAPVAPVSLLAQYDNNGMNAYGRNRYIAGISIPGRLLPGDQTDILVLASSGMTYGHLGYELPLRWIDARMGFWGTGLAYKVPEMMSGNTMLFGGGLRYPLHISTNVLWIAQLNYNNRHETYKLLNNTPVANKRIHSGQCKIDASYLLTPAQSLHFNAGLTLGILDLSAIPAVEEQDKISARTANGFARVGWSAAWNSMFGPNEKFDARLKIKGQLASKNLDQSEKFALGGALGIRAYSSSEALGDEGSVANTELGYWPVSGLRSFFFYDIGRTRLYKKPWVVQENTQEYTLQGAGVGLSYTWQFLVATLTYAQQIGTNPGLSASGVDSDGSRSRQRLWLALTWRG